MLGSISIFIIPCQGPWLPILSEVAHLFNICGLLVIKCHHLACITWGKGDIISIVINQSQLCSNPRLFLCQPRLLGDALAPHQRISDGLSEWCVSWAFLWNIILWWVLWPQTYSCMPTSFLFILLPHARVTETFLLYSALAIPFSRFLKAPLQFVSSPRVFATVLNPVPPESAPNSMNSWLYSLIFQPLWSSNLKIQLQDTLLASVCIC